MRIMSVFTSFGGLEKTGGFAQTIVMSNNPKVDDPCPITIENSTCRKRGCKVAFLKGWAPQSPETGNLPKPGIIIQGCTPTQQCTSKQVVMGPKIGNRENGPAPP